MISQGAVGAEANLLSLCELLFQKVVMQSFVRKRHGKEHARHQKTLAAARRFY